MTKKIEKSLAQKIKIFMLTNNISQKELAKKMGLTPAAISKVLAKDNSMRTGTLEKIAHALGTDYNYFFADVQGDGNAIGNNNNTCLQTDFKNDIDFIKKELEVHRLKLENLTLKIENLQQKK